MKEIQDLGLELESQMEKLKINEHTETRNTQILYKEFKDQMI